MRHRQSFRMPFLSAITAVLALVLSASIVSSPAAAATNRSISGHVDLGTTGSAAPAGDVTVEAWQYSFGNASLAASVPVDSNGDYTVTGLSSAQDYSFYFRYVGAQNFSSIGWGNVALGYQPTLFAKSASDLTGQNIVLPSRAAISGVVNLSSALPVGAGDVLVTYSKQTGPYRTFPSDAVWSGESASVPTDANGRFTFPNLDAGRYNFHFTPQIAGYQSHWSGPALSLNHSFDTSFVAGADKSDLVVALMPLQTVSGTIYLGSTSNPAGAGDATVTLERHVGSGAPSAGPWSAVSSVATAAGGGYSFGSLATGSYRLQVTYERGNKYLPGSVDQTYGFLLDGVTAVPSKNLTLTETFGISGHVDLGTVGNSAGPGEVQVWLAPTGCCAGDLGPFLTDADGDYTITGLAPAYYIVKYTYVGSGPYKGAVYPGDGNANFPGMVRLIADAAGVDAVLPFEGGTINVSVTAQGLQPSDYAVTGAIMAELLRFDLGTGDWVVVDSGAVTSPSTVVSFADLDADYYFVTVTYDGPKGFDSSTSPLIEVTAGSLDAFAAELKPANLMTCNHDPSLPSACRIGGASRFNVSASISELGFDPGVDVVYIANGLNYPDALSAAPAAALEGGPLLLVTPDEIPAPIRAEITRLHPNRIVVVGGPASVSPAVFNQLATMATQIKRITGADRYDVSRAMAEYAFGDIGADVAYITTGNNFPDALSSGGAASQQFAPVITVDGYASSVDAATRQLLIDLGVTTVKIAGGPGSVSEGIATSIDNIPGITVVRLWGPTRYEASGAINRDAFTGSAIVFLAVGTNYPDALSGGALAGAFGAPIYVIPSDCIPGYVMADIVNFGASTVIVLGGPGSVSNSVLDYRVCGG